MTHVVLLGDSVFANAAYVPGEPDVIRQLRVRLPTSFSATRLAVDGAVTRDVGIQLQNLPADTTHIVVSFGGNDALSAAYVLFENVRSVAESLVKLSAIKEQFAKDYRRMLDTITARKLPTAVCTIYDGRADSEAQQCINVAALSLYNDIITREAFRRALPVIDLRFICNEPDDYANPIEPSAQGGEKIAAAIAELVTSGEHLPRSHVFTSKAV